MRREIVFYPLAINQQKADFIGSSAIKIDDPNAASFAPSACKPASFTKPAGIRDNITVIGPQGQEPLQPLVIVITEQGGHGPGKDFRFNE